MPVVWVIVAFIPRFRCALDHTCCAKQQEAAILPSLGSPTGRKLELNARLASTTFAIPVIAPASR